MEVGSEVIVNTAIDVGDGGSEVRVGLNVAVEGAIRVVVGVLVNAGMEVRVGV